MLRDADDTAQGRFRMNKERVKSVGISFLGGHSGIEGHYELAIDSIRAVNEEDAGILGKPYLFRPRVQTDELTTKSQKRILQRAPGGNEIEAPSDPDPLHPHHPLFMSLAHLPVRPSCVK